MKHILLFIFSFLVANIGYTQSFNSDRIVANSSFVEISYAGKTIAGTVNYERYVGHSAYMTYYANVAVGYWKLGEGRTSIEDGVTVVNVNDGYMVPITIHGLLFNSRSHIEMGFGINLIYENILEKINVQPIVNLGYRIQPLNGGLVLRVNANLGHAFFPGISVGYSF